VRNPWLLNVKNCEALYRQGIQLCHNITYRVGYSRKIEECWQSVCSSWLSDVYSGYWRNFGFGFIRCCV